MQPDESLPEQRKEIGYLVGVHPQYNDENPLQENPATLRDTLSGNSEPIDA